MVHVDRMRPYLHELDESDTGKPSLSNASSMPGKSPMTSNQMLDMTIPSQSTIAPQSVKAGKAVEPAAPAVSTPTDRALATDATDAPPAEAIDSITDTDMAVADMSGAGPASASSTDKPTSRSDSNFRAKSANSTPAEPRAQGDHVTVDVAYRPHPPQANRPRRTSRKPARLLDCVRWGESELSFGFQSPSCAYVEQTLSSSYRQQSACKRVEMSAKEMSESAESVGGDDLERSSASTPEAVDRRWSRASTASPPGTRLTTPSMAAPENEVRGSMEPGGASLRRSHPAGLRVVEQ